MTTPSPQSPPGLEEGQPFASLRAEVAELLAAEGLSTRLGMVLRTVIPLADRLSQAEADRDAAIKLATMAGWGPDSDKPQTLKSSEADRDALAERVKALEGTASAFLNRVVELEPHIDARIATETVIRGNPWPHGDWVSERDALTALLQKDPSHG